MHGNELQTFEFLISRSLIALAAPFPAFEVCEGLQFVSVLDFGIRFLDGKREGRRADCRRGDHGGGVFSASRSR